MSSEDSDLTPISDDGFLGKPSSRRTFLKAAALGTAAAAVWQKGPGLRFGPAAAFADDLSGLNCTANDVRIVGPGTILNEPCTCTGGTFNAEVSFHVINNTGTTRYCVTAHFCPGTNGFSPGDIVFGNIPANFDGNVTVTIPNYPCSSGLVCFGERGSQLDGSFLKGEACPAGKCCSTITWNVKANDPCPDTTRQISSKCRHQQICIQGYGATLTCKSGCTPTCGDSTVLTGTVSGGVGPYFYVLSGSDGTSQRFPATGTTNDTSHDFTVTATAATTYTLTVTDSRGCTRTASTSIAAPGQPSPIITVDATACNGVVNFSASAAGFTGCTSAWTINGAAPGTFTNDDTTLVRVKADGSLDVRILDGLCKTIAVTLTCGACSGPASVSRTWPCVTSNATACS
jgi:hypothetical protein